MLQTCLRAIALPATLVALSTAQAADDVLRLACRGTATSAKKADAKPEPIFMSIVVNFAKRTVHGFGASVSVNVIDVNEVTVSFGGSSPSGSVNGSIDRVTGEATATSVLSDAKTGDILLMNNLALKCRPGQRMF
jgi:hypothetical protein